MNNIPHPLYNTILPAFISSTKGKKGWQILSNAPVDLLTVHLIFSNIRWYCI